MLSFNIKSFGVKCFKAKLFLKIWFKLFVGCNTPIKKQLVNKL